jgi:K+-sensing histidine kinase KdpD
VLSSADDENNPLQRAEMHRLSHDIRSVLQGLLGYLAIFDEEVKPHLEAEEAQLFDRIEFFAQKLSDHITYLLARLNREHDDEQGGS